MNLAESSCSSSAVVEEVTLGGNKDDWLGEATGQFDCNAGRLVFYSGCPVLAFGYCDKDGRKSGDPGEYRAASILLSNR